MDDDATSTDLKALLQGAYEDASAYGDLLADERARAFDYYLGDVYTRDGEPEKPEDIQGRTSIVAREVADVIHQMLPGIIRIFTSGEEVVRYEPVSEEDVPLAEQQTDYVNYLLDADGNNWFTTLHDAIHDALLKKAGVIKWWWDERATVEEMSFSGLSPVQADQLRQDPEIEVLEEETTQSSLGAVSPAGPPPAGAAPGANVSPAQTGAALPAAAVPADVTIDMRVRRTRYRRCLRVMAVPPEEFVIARDARDIATATYVAHRSLPTVSELVEQGYDREEVERRASPDLSFFTSSDGEEEAIQRTPGREMSGSGAPPDKSLWRVMHVEHFIRFDADNDGIAEIHKVCTVGEDFGYVYDDEIVPEAPFALGSPVRMPHAVVGMSVADQVMDLQDLKTNVLRSTLDSLAQAIFPSTAVVENAVNMQDVLSTEVGRVIRMTAPGMVQPLSEPFIGPQALGVMAYLDQIKASRTGITNASTGLDDKVLQSTTRTAVENTVERAQERVEMIARTLAETLIKDTFRGILRCIVRNQDQPRTVRLRNRWVEVDPRFWNAECDVRVNVGLGRGTDMQRMAFLQQIAMKQEQIITATGPSNPLVAPSQFRATLAEMLRLAGFKDAAKFFKPLTPEDDARIAQEAQQNRPKDPATLLAEAELAKVQAEQQMKQEELRLKFMTAQAEDDRARDKEMMEFVLKAAEIQAKYGAQVDIAAMKTMVDRERSAFQAQQDAQLQQQAAQMGHQRDMALGQQKIASAEEVARFRAQQQAQAAMQRAAARPQAMGGGGGPV